MDFTGQLGGADSAPGQLQLGLAGDAAPAAFDPAAGFPWPECSQPDRTPPAAVPYQE